MDDDLVHRVAGAALEDHRPGDRRERRWVQVADRAAFCRYGLDGGISVGAEEAVDRTGVVAEARESHLQRLQRIDLFDHKRGPFGQRKTPPERRGAGRSGRSSTGCGWVWRRALCLPGGGQFGGKKGAAFRQHRDLLAQFGDIGG